MDFEKSENYFKGKTSEKVKKTRKIASKTGSKKFFKKFFRGFSSKNAQKRVKRGRFSSFFKIIREIPKIGGIDKILFLIKLINRHQFFHEFKKTFGKHDSVLT